MPDSVSDIARQNLVSALWPTYSPPSMKTWAILDAARDERIYGAVERTYQDKCCLFAGTLSPELTMVAPYLVELGKDDRLTAFVLGKGWGNDWGIFLRSNAPLETLRRHFRTFLRVKDEGGKHLLFRYYDPRVLRIFLPTCLPDQLKIMFNSVDRFMMEDQSGNGVIEFQSDGMNLKTATVDLQHRRDIAAMATGAGSSG